MLSNQPRYHIPQLLFGRVSDVSVKGPGFNPGPGTVYIYRLSSAAIAASSICCIFSTYTHCKPRAAFDFFIGQKTFMQPWTDTLP